MSDKLSREDAKARSKAHTNYSMPLTPTLTMFPFAASRESTTRKRNGRMSEGELILFRSQDGQSEVQLRVDGDTVWLTQLEIADLFATTKQNVSLHIQNILEEGELPPEATVKDSLTVQMEGKREVKRKTQLYSLPMILAIGYRVRSPRGTEFRQLAFPAMASSIR